MKKLLPWLLLLLLLIILCIYTKIDDIHLSSKSETSTLTTATNVKNTQYIDYVIVQREKSYELKGNFASVEQSRQLASAFTKAKRSIATSNIATNSTLMDDDGLVLTDKILPHFIKNYRNGKISYAHKILHISGMVNSQEEINSMQILLSGVKNITVKNDTRLDPEVLKKAAAQKRAIIEAKEKAIADALIAKLAQEQAELQRQNNLEAERMKAAADEAEAKRQAVLNAKLEQERLAAQLAQKEAEEQKKQNALLAQEAEKVVEQTSMKKAQEVLKQKNVASTETQAQRAKKNVATLLRVENIEFQVAKGSLTSKGQSTVTKLSNILKQYPNINIEIAGHTDSDGSALFNKKLSQSRVNTVKSRLISNGLKEDRLTAKGYGESQPLVPNTSKANKQKNRRVEINIQGE